MGKKGAWPRSRDLLFKFWDSLISLERLKVQNSNLAGRLMVRETKPKKWKMGQKGAWPRSRDLFFYCWDPLLSLERLKVQTSNFACVLKVRDSKRGNEKWVKRGRGLGHVTYFSNLWTPWYTCGMAENTKLIFCKRIEGKGYLTENENLVKRGVAWVTWPTFQILLPC